ncbi:MAG: hypothetical protein SFV81_26980 [Pirellulaceae bacterium]|nr:hypothetical protein [Pirellulaceae bacterium]
MDATQGRIASFRSRRIIASSLTLASVFATALAVQSVANRLGDASIATGWTLLIATAGLYLLSLRKKLIQFRLGPVSAWLQMHTYMGSFASVVFLMHIGWPIRGVFEIALATCFTIVAVSGIVLTYMSRALPRRLAAIKQDFRLELIPALRLSVTKEAHELAIHSASFGEGATLVEFYQQRLLPFFLSRRSWLYRLIPTGYTRRQLLRELNDLDRYLAAQGLQSRQQLAAMVQTKDDLDYHYALQSRLRMMFAMHVALTWSLAIMIAIHVVLVYRFQGAV